MGTTRFYPSIASLRALEAFERLGSVTKAADELALTQSAVSRQLQTLENHVSVSMFVRDGKRIALTPAALNYARDIRTALMTIQNASIRLKANPRGGSFNLAILPSFSVRWLAPKLPDFVARHPEVTLNLGTNLEPFDFDTEPYHAAIHFGAPDWPDANHMELMTETVIPVAAPALLKRNPTTSVADIMEQPLLHMNSRPNAWEAWFQMNGTVPTLLTGPLFDQFATMTQAAVHGLGFALLPEYIIERELEKGLLEKAVDVPPVSLGKYYLVWPKTMSEYQPTITFKNWLSRYAASGPITSA
ncbi:LysR family transcriptional regulator [Kordiimonas lacus]|uniref:Transcriptional regulator, LysR family n=1 Tax=Kordiimonas lacus TaxID=637679 RepID=A0A1G6VET2_9PROT|nr:LysR family transcriptional regulator [Kordiimonas lacus]SDD51517.1 transcriptional regulator, LysR family [Kordiimonas lacus]